MQGADGLGTLAESAAGGGGAGAVRAVSALRSDPGEAEQRPQRISKRVETPPVTMHVTRVEVCGLEPRVRQTQEAPNIYGARSLPRDPISCIARLPRSSLAALLQSQQGFGKYVGGGIQERTRQTGASMG